MIRNLAIFSKEKDSYIRRFIKTRKIKKVVILCDKEHIERLKYEFEPLYIANIHKLSNKRNKEYNEMLNILDKNTLLIVYNCDLIYKYAKPVTRALLYTFRKKTGYRIICGESLVKSEEYADIFSIYFFLDPQILKANHYWCFKANHKEIDVFDKVSIRDMQDVSYLARKIQPYTIFENEPTNELEKLLERVVI